MESSPSSLNYLDQKSAQQTQEANVLIPKKTAAAEVVNWLKLGRIVFMVSAGGVIVTELLKVFDPKLGYLGIAVIAGVNLFALYTVKLELVKLQTKYGV